MATTQTKTPAAVNRVAAVLESKERMRRHSPEQKVAIIDAILRDSYKSAEFMAILYRYGVNPSALTRWIQETRE